MVWACDFHWHMPRHQRLTFPYRCVGRIIGGNRMRSSLGLHPRYLERNDCLRFSPWPPLACYSVWPILDSGTSSRHRIGALHLTILRTGFNNDGIGTTLLVDRRKENRSDGFPPEKTNLATSPHGNRPSINNRQFNRNRGR